MRIGQVSDLPLEDFLVQEYGATPAKRLPDTRLREGDQTLGAGFAVGLGNHDAHGLIKRKRAAVLAV